MPRFALSEDQIQHYRTEGFIVIPSVFSREEMAEIDRVIKDMT